ncbi:MAG: DNA polymerase III subunit, partial [Saprospiraceae bacterium]
MRLLDTFGQPAIRQQWDTVLQQGKLPHAILLYGEPGSGILPGALSLANDILCSSPVYGKACRKCPSCNRAQKLIHPDLHFLLPLAGSKSLSIEYYDAWREAIIANPWMNVFQWTQFSDVEGKQVDIHKEDIQQVTSNLSYESFEGGNKVLIIWMSQFLAKEGNRLLKMIEEPPSQTYFILVTNQREQILPTIRSRCMQIFFPPISSAEINSLLLNLYHTDARQAEQIALQSVNDMGRAMALTQNSIVNLKEELTAWFRTILSKKPSEMTAWTTRMAGLDKEEQKQFLLYAIASVREILHENSDQNIYSHQTGSREMFKYMNEHFDPVSWQPIVQGMQTGYEKIARNANTKLLWLFLTITIKNTLS